MLEIENFDNYALVTLRGILDDDINGYFDICETVDDAIGRVAG